MVKELDNPDYAEMLRRFETEMDVEKSKNTDDLFRKFRYWSGHEPSYKQKNLLEKYAEQKGITKTITVTERPQFSTTYKTYQQWKTESKGKTAYKTRIERYMIKHPKATLSEARGHLKRRG